MENRRLGRPRCRQEDNIKMDLKEIGCKDMDWIHLAQKCPVISLVKVVLNLSVQ
jgi:hypothetical protein